MGLNIARRTARRGRCETSVVAISQVAAEGPQSPVVRPCEKASTTAGTPRVAFWI
jgi:hypothetical protein